MAVLALATAAQTQGATWADVTKLFITNPAFDNNSNEGWTWDSNASTQEVRVECISFYNGHFNLHQEISGLPKGHYRLSVQGFYRMTDNGSAYSAHQSNQEDLTAFLYADTSSKPLMSLYENSLDYNAANRCYTPDDQHYYPDGKEAALAAFADGLYVNTLEFDAEGTFTIGVRCDDYWGNNYCVLDNFTLEYYGEMDKAKSIDVKIENTTLVVGETIKATASITPASALRVVEWSSSNENVATIDQDGVITAIDAGNAIITAKAIDGSGVKGTCKIKVESNTAKAGSVIINEIMASNIDEYISPAFNFDGWIELYNPTDKPVQLYGLAISDPVNGLGPWHMPKNMGTIPAKGFYVVWFDSNDIAQTNAPFKLDTDGGTITITTADGKELASQTYPASLERISYARSTDGTGDWGFTGTPTPGASNNGIELQKEQLAAPTVDLPSQMFSGDLSVNVTIPAGCTLRYTTDGTLPTLENGQTSKTGQFKVSETSSYRFRLYAKGMLPSRVTTRSYILKDLDYYLPVVSVVTDPDFLYSKEIGVMTKGPNGRPGNGQNDKCNWNMNWERPVNFSYLNAEGEMVLNQDVNLEMCGGWSRAWSPHAFKLKGSKEMGGDKNLPYPFFTQKPYIRNRTLQIRNGGNDKTCRIKDPALQYIAQSSGMNIDCQSYQPIHEFINGNYIGVLNVREPNNKHYVYANYGWDDDEIDQFEMSPDSGYVQKCGTPDAFNELVDILSPDAANSDTYEEICRRLDIDAYANYMAIQMYLGNWDWPQNNVKGFRYRNDGKFRFVLFDLDGSFSTDTPFDTFAGKEWYWFDQLYPTSLGRIVDRIRFVSLFLNLLENADFNRRFIDAYSIVGGSVYEKTRATDIVSQLSDFVEPAMKLNGTSTKSTVSTLKNRLNARLNSATSTLKNYWAFDLKSTPAQKVTLESDTEGAMIYINGQEVPTGSFIGNLFAPVKLKAQAPAGYKFAGWVNPKDPNSAVIADAETDLPSGTNIFLTATFTPLSKAEMAEQGITPVRINELSGSNDAFIDEYGKKGDWLELYNTTDKEIDVEGMYLSDDKDNPTKYMITKGDTKANTKIAAHGHLIVWCDNKRATTDNGLHASFKISSNAGLLTLMAADRSWKDAIYYGAHDATTTVGRYPDGTSNVYSLSMATIGQTNRYTSYMKPVEQSEVKTGMAYIAAANGLRICYGSQQLLVKSEDNEKVTVSIYRADGQQAGQYSLNVQGGKARVDVANLNQGFYVAKATDSNGNTVSCKFMK